MNSVQTAFRPALRPAEIGNRPLHIGRAINALRRLRRNKDDTGQVFAIIRALSGRTASRGYRRMLGLPEGARQAYIGDELSWKLSDPAWLAGFAPGTVGACYREFVGLRDLSAEGLSEESRKVGDPDVDAAHPIAWYTRRLRDIHDVWHVLTGYGTDRLGELCILSLTHAQTRAPGVLLIAAAGGLQMTWANRRQPYAKAIIEAWRIGRAADWMPAIDYGTLFSDPLEIARERLHIKRPAIYESISLETRGAFLDAVDRELRIARASKANQ
jgi:ubiquinone biosynthesis protein COQ4